MFVSQTTAVTDMRNQTSGTESKEQKSVSRYSSSLLVSVVPTYHSSRMAVLASKEHFQCICCTVQNVNLYGTKKSK